MNKFLDMVQCRRSRYQISNEATLPNEKIIELVESSVKHTPTPFNSQGSRVILLLGENHKKLWNIVLNELKKVVPKDTFVATEEKIALFANGYGTILFFEDANVIKSLEEKLPLYKENFAIWANQANAMLQFVLWTALANEGMGATLQHYNKLIDEEVRKAFDVPTNWILNAQMPFGKPAAPDSSKDFSPIENRVKVLT